jgi:hypothetical protein
MRYAGLEGAEGSTGIVNLVVRYLPNPNAAPDFLLC